MAIEKQPRSMGIRDYVRTAGEIGRGIQKIDWRQVPGRIRAEVAALRYGQDLDRLRVSGARLGHQLAKNIADMNALLGKEDILNARIVANMNGDASRESQTPQTLIPGENDGDSQSLDTQKLLERKMEDINSLLKRLLPTDPLTSSPFAETFQRANLDGQIRELIKIARNKEATLYIDGAAEKALFRRMNTGWTR